MSADALPRNFLRPCLLFLLREQPSHGYDLLERLRPLGFTRPDAGGVYRALRALEREELVRSAWEESPEGPDRRIYQLTRPGMRQLHIHAKELVQAKQTLDVFLTRYAEFVSLHATSTRPGRATAVDDARTYSTRRS